MFSDSYQSKPRPSNSFMAAEIPKTISASLDTVLKNNEDVSFLERHGNDDMIKDD